MCGSGAGLCAKVAIYPLDMIKKRLQIQGFESGRIGFGKNQYYSGFLSCARGIVLNEGLRAFYKGLSPSLIKATVSVGCHFYFYEQFCHLLALALDAKK